MTQMDKGDSRMTERDVFVAMLNRAQIGWQPDPSDPETDIRITAKDGPHNEGYTEFFAIFEFTDDGYLRTVGVWE